MTNYQSGIVCLCTHPRKTHSGGLRPKCLAVGCGCERFLKADIDDGGTMPLLSALQAETGETNSSDAVRLLEEAMTLIAGDRHEDYGPADVEFDRIAIGWRVIFADGVVDNRRVALAMVWLKSCRELASNKRDNWVDIAGYAGLGGTL